MSINCKHCGDTIVAKQNTKTRKFCSKSCAASFNNATSPKRKKKERTACLNCNSTLKHHQQKYCSNACQQQYVFTTITVPKIEAGDWVHPKTHKKYLMLKGEDCCSECGVGSVWQGKPLTLHLDHIDGDSDNNKLENLRILCPNCHTQTATYGSRGMGNRYKKKTKRNVYLRQFKGYIES